MVAALEEVGVIRGMLVVVHLEVDGQTVILERPSL